MAGPTKKEKLSTLKRFKAKQHGNYATTSKKHEVSLMKTLREAEKIKSPLKMIILNEFKRPRA